MPPQSFGPLANDGPATPIISIPSASVVSVIIRIGLSSTFCIHRRDNDGAIDGAEESASSIGLLEAKTMQILKNAFWISGFGQIQSLTRVAYSSPETFGW